MGRRTLLLIAALLIAALGTALVWLYVRGADERALGDQAAVKVWVTRAAVTTGTSAQTVLTAQYTDVRDVAAPLAAGALTDASQVKGLVTTVPIPPGVVVTAGLFGSTDKAPLPIKIDKNMVAMAVQVGDPQRVAGFLGEGSSITIFVTISGSGSATAKGTTSTSETTMVLDKVKVLTTGSTATQPVTRTGADGQTTTQNLPLSIVTLEVSADDAQKLIHAQSAGTLYFALLNPGESGRPNSAKVSTDDLLR
jgi:pilus assembly protein CpaB